MIIRGMKNMIKCPKCQMESDDFIIKTHEGTGEKMIWSKSREMPHTCSGRNEKPVKCPKCDPLTRKYMPAWKLQEHIKKEHLGFW